MFEMSIIVAVITGVVQVFKQFVQKEFMPIVALALGVVAGVAFVDGAIQEQIFIGIALGLSSAGLFDVAKIPSKTKSKQ